MKLPGITYQLGTPSLGREDVNAPARQWAADQQVIEATDQLVGTAVDLTTKFVKAQEDEGARQRSLQIQKRLQETYNKISEKQSYDLTNPDDASLLQGTNYTKMDGEGKQKSVIGSHEVMQQVWQKQREQILADGRADMSPYQLKQIEKDVSQFLFQRDSAIQVNDIRARNQHMRATATQNIQDLVDAGMVDKALEEIDKSVPFTDAEREELKVKVQVRNEANQIEKAMFAPDTGEAAMAYADYLESEDYQGLMTAEQRDAAAGRLRRQATEKHAEITAQQEKIKNKFLSDLEIGLVKGVYSEFDVEKAYIEGRMDEGTRTRLTKLAISEAEKRVTRDTSTAMVMGALNNGKALNPYNPDVQKAVNTYADDLDPSSPSYLTELSVVAIKTGFMPQKLEDAIAGKLINGNEEQAAQALQTYEALLDQDQGKKLVGFMPDQTKDLLDTAAYFSRAGAPSTKAAVAQAKEVLNVKPEIREQRKIEYTTLRKKTDAAKELKKMMEKDSEIFNVETNFGLGAVADVPVVSDMTAEYSRGVELYYGKTGDIELAKHMAYQNLQRTWGITEVAGKKRAMKFPPERTANLTTEDVNAALLGYAEFYQVNPDNIRIVSDSYTARDLDSWRVMIVDPETGFPMQPSDVIGQREADRFTPHDWVAIGKETLWQREAVDVKSEHELEMRKEQFRQRVKEQAAKRGYRGAETVDIYKGVGW